MIRLSLVFVFIALHLTGSCVRDSIGQDLVLWYQHPAQDWMQEALPIGNGYMGAMFFGGIEEERIQFNEESLWSGGPGEWVQYQGGNRPGAYKYLEEVRELLAHKKFDAAHELARKQLTGIIKEDLGDSQWVGFGSYQSFGDLLIRCKADGESSNYLRKLDIGRATAEVSYERGSIHYHRTYFASYPARLLVFHFENDAEEGVDYEIEITSLHRNKSVFWAKDQLIMRGNVENNQMTFESRIKVACKDGITTFKDGVVSISGTNEFTLYLTAATDYINEYPTYKGGDPSYRNELSLANVMSFQNLQTAHEADYQSLFSRVELELGPDLYPELATDQRLVAYQNGSADPSLEALYFQYGRYLLISSSRPGTLPANLQGKWNHLNNPPWACDYHANINIQMIYWPAEICNLAEVHKPLIEYIDNLRPPGRESAKHFFDARGWIVNTMNNVFGYTAPGWDFPWGFFPAGAAWYCRHVWQHYVFNPDLEYLKKRAYPIMRAAALFWLDYLIEDDQGYLVSCPSYSPNMVVFPQVHLWISKLSGIFLII